MAKSNWKKQIYGKGNSYSEKIYVSPGCRLKLRLVGQLVRMVRIYTLDRQNFIIDSEDTVKKICDKHAGKITNVSVRYISWCIDRLDGKLKIVEMPQYVVSQIGERAKSGKGISDDDQGCDWRITTNDETGRDVRYKVEFIKESSLTDEEKRMIEFRKNDEKREFDLTKIYAGLSLRQADYELSKILFSRLDLMGKHFLSQIEAKRAVG